MPEAKLASAVRLMKIQEAVRHREKRSGAAICPLKFWLTGGLPRPLLFGSVFISFRQRGLAATERLRPAGTLPRGKLERTGGCLGAGGKAGERGETDEDTRSSSSSREAKRRGDLPVEFLALRQTAAPPTFWVCLHIIPAAGARSEGKIAPCGALPRGKLERTGGCWRAGGKAGEGREADAGTRNSSSTREAKRRGDLPVEILALRQTAAPPTFWVCLHVSPAAGARSDGKITPCGRPPPGEYYTSLCRPNTKNHGAPSCFIRLKAVLAAG